MKAKQTEDMTVAETLDAIFGEGTAEREFTPEELEIARQPYQYTPPAPGHTVRLKITPSGFASPTHPQAPLGRHGSVRTIQICSVPAGVSMAEVCRRYNTTVDLSDSVSWEFDRLKTGAILR